ATGRTDRIAARLPERRLRPTGPGLLRRRSGIREDRRSPDIDRGIRRCSIEDSSVGLLLALLLRHPHHAFQALAFQFEHAPSQPGQFVVPAARVIQSRRRPLLALRDQPAANQPLQRAIESRGPKANRPVRPLQDFLHNAVAMLLFPYQREQNMEPVGMQGKEVSGIYWHYDIYILQNIESRQAFFEPADLAFDFLCVFSVSAVQAPPGLVPA